MKLKLSILAALILLFNATTAFADAESSKELEKIISKVRNAPSVSVDFVIESNGEKTKGNIVLAGNRFALSTPEGKTWFNGKTLWSYSASVNEVNISEPTSDELAEINPFSFFESARNNYVSKSMKTSSATTKEISLTLKPGVNKSVRTASVFYDPKTLQPVRMLLDIDGHSLTIRILSIQNGKLLPDAAFTFNKKDAPTAEIVDLR